MAKGLQRSLSRGPQSSAPIVKQTIKVNHSIDSVTVGAAIGFGSVVIGDFPQGNILFLGCVANLQFAGPTSADLSDTWAGDFGVGTTPVSDATISAGDEDLVAETTLAAATAELSPKTRGAVAAAAIAVLFDNTDGSLEINLNLLVDTADQVDDKTVAILATGEVYISYVVLGDD